MSHLINLIGHEPFVRLTVIERSSNNSKGGARWLCECSCGNRTVVCGEHLLSGHTESCGCLQKEKVLERSTRHGQGGRGKRTKAFNKWVAALYRCECPTNRAWEDYGGRGIKMCAGFKEFENFFAALGHPPSRATLDRRDNNGHYSCGRCQQCLTEGWAFNCRWATVHEQARNKRNNRFFTFGGKTMCIAEWARSLGGKSSLIQNRLSRGWSVEEALTTQPGRRKRQTPRTSSASSS